MTVPAKQSLGTDNTYKVGDLVMVHGVHLAIVMLVHEPENLWLVRLMDGTQLALWYNDLEPLNKTGVTNDR